MRISSFLANFCGNSNKNAELVNYSLELDAAADMQHCRSDKRTLSYDIDPPANRLEEGALETIASLAVSVAFRSSICRSSRSVS
jgi:hypothetical protein